MRTDKIRKHVLPNIPYLFILWCCIKLGTAYRLAAETGFGEKLVGMINTIGPAFGTLAPGHVGFDWIVGIIGAVIIRLLVYYKIKKRKKVPAQYRIRFGPMGYGEGHQTVC